MVDKQDLPVGATLAEATQNAFATIFNCCPTAGSAKSIGARINGVGEDIIYRCIDRQLPQNLRAPWALIIAVGQ